MLYVLQKVKALHVEDMDVVVEPGIGWMELNEYLKPYGLFFPLDPGRIVSGIYYIIVVIVLSMYFSEQHIFFRLFF